MTPAGNLRTAMALWMAGLRVADLLQDRGFTQTLSGQFPPPASPCPRLHIAQHCPRAVDVPCTTAVWLPATRDIVQPVRRSSFPPTADRSPVLTACSAWACRSLLVRSVATCPFPSPSRAAWLIVVRTLGKYIDTPVSPAEPRGRVLHYCEIGARSLPAGPPCPPWTRTPAPDGGGEVELAYRSM